MRIPYIFILLFFYVGLSSICQAQDASANYQRHWEIPSQGCINWNLENNQNLPHTDNIEMAGKKVAGIISYTIDTLGMLSIERQVFFPQLHPFIKANEPGWWVYRAYQKDIYKDDVLPRLFVGDKRFVPGKVKTVTIDGLLNFEHEPSSGLKLKREFYPDPSARLFIERWTLINTTDSLISMVCGNTMLQIEDYGADGKYTQSVSSDAPSKVDLKPNEVFSFSLRIMAKMESEEFPTTASEVSLTERKKLINNLSNALILETPDPVLNTLFTFSKIRASESIFDSRMGLIHSPGGGRYYVGFWANDQAEYISPLFPYLGYEIGNESAMNCYRAFAKEMNPEYKAIRYAFEMENLVPPFALDRGDAAMIAYGASQFALANGDRKAAKELWPLIEWCLEYCHRQLNERGVVKSESDEMEGRIETGNANLSTSSLYYGALDNSSHLANSLGASEASIMYLQRAKNLGAAIENYFGAKVEGLETYKYYEEHRHLRHWICLPLVVGIHERKDATIDALFNRLWADENGVYVEKNSDNPDISKIFWDRGTLYALRGTFYAGATETSLQKLQEYSGERLLGKRVPYAVEAFPEGSMAHLSAESGLYCRIFTEGMFGIMPTGFSSFNCTPRLPKDWPEMKLKNIKAFGDDFDIVVSRKGEELNLRIFSNKQNEVITEKVIEDGETISVLLK